MLNFRRQRPISSRGVQGIIRSIMVVTRGGMQNMQIIWSRVGWVVTGSRRMQNGRREITRNAVVLRELGHHWERGIELSVHG